MDFYSASALINAFLSSSLGIFVYLKNRKKLTNQVFFLFASTVGLWSRHVDINPGDRRETCRGLMEPVGVETKSDGYVIVHRCLGCGAERRNKASREDNFEAVLKLA